MTIDFEAELARIRSDLASVRANFEQALRAVDAEIAARVRSDALIATLREYLAGEVSRSAVRVALAQYDEALRELPSAAEPPADTPAARARTFVGLLKRSGGED